MSEIERRVGAALDWKPRRALVRQALDGRYTRLEPLDPARHARDLWELSHGPSGDPLMWTYMGYGPFADETAFRKWLDACATSLDPLWLTVIDKASGRAVGVVTFMRIVPDQGVIEIGHIWFVPSIQRSRVTTEAIYLTMVETFEGLGYRRLEWKCDSLNAFSRRAAVRFGFHFEGIFRQHMIYKGRSRDTAWYSIIDKEWPGLRAGYERWLAPDNFDDAGRQKKSLAACGVEGRAVAPD